MTGLAHPTLYVPLFIRDQGSGEAHTNRRSGHVIITVEYSRLTIAARTHYMKHIGGSCRVG